MTDFTKFEFGASFEVLWLKSPPSPSPKPLYAIRIILPNMLILFEIEQY
jgi:hypothetical protein